MENYLDSSSGFITLDEYRDILLFPKPNNTKIGHLNNFSSDFVMSLTVDAMELRLGEYLHSTNYTKFIEITESTFLLTATDDYIGNIINLIILNPRFTIIH